MIDIIAAILLLVGSAFSLLAAIGILRMPDFYARLQCSTKASTLGVGCVVAAAAIHFESPGTTTRALLVIAFLMLTAPVAAQLLGRAALAENVPMWKKTVVDELHEYDDDSPQALENLYHLADSPEMTDPNSEPA